MQRIIKKVRLLLQYATGLYGLNNINPGRQPTDWEL